MKERMENIERTYMSQKGVGEADKVNW